jgi:hypothetical protein
MTNLASRHRHIISGMVGVAVAALAVGVLSAPAQAAGDDYTEFSFAGKWVTKTMTEGAPLGNVMTLKKGCAGDKNCYTGAIKFHYQDGKISKPTKVQLRVKPSTLTVVWADGKTSPARVVDGNIVIGSGCKDRLLFASGQDRLPRQCEFLAVQ